MVRLLITIVFFLLLTPAYSQTKRVRVVNKGTSQPPSVSSTRVAGRPNQSLLRASPQFDKKISSDGSEYRQLVKEYVELSQQLTEYSNKLEREQHTFPSRVFKELLETTGAGLLKIKLPKWEDVIELIHFVRLCHFYWEEVLGLIGHQMELDRLEARLRELDSRGSALGLWSELMRAGFFSPPDETLIFRVESSVDLKEANSPSIILKDNCDVPSIENMNPAARMALCVSKQLLRTAASVNDPELKNYLLMASGASIHEVGGPINFQQVIFLWQAYRSLEDTEGEDLRKREEQLEAQFRNAKSKEEAAAILSALDKLGEDIERFNERVKALIWSNLRVSAPNEYIPIIKENGKGKSEPDVIRSSRKKHRLAKLIITNQTGAEMILMIGQEVFHLMSGETASTDLLADGYFVAGWLPFPPGERNIVEGHSFLVLEEGQEYKASINITHN